MTIEEIREGAPKSATHYWKNEYGHAYYCYCQQIERWMYYDKHHDYWFSQRDGIEDKIKPLF